MTEILETPKLVTVFGGSGFIGRHVVRALAKRGYRIRVATRRPELAGHLQPLGNVGQIQPVQANLRVRWSVDRAVEGADHVINLVGILYECGAQTFSAVQDVGARAVAEAAKAVGARLTHGSAIGADADSKSAYARTKALGEKAVLETVKDAVIFRPSIIFGPEDQFFNRFANMARYSPVLPLIGGGKTKFQPVFVGDVAEAIARSVDGDVQGRPCLRARRPERADLPAVHGADARCHRPQAAAGAGAVVAGSDAGRGPRPAAEAAADARPGDAAEDRQCRVARRPRQDGRTFAGLGIQPQSTAAILPSYLWRYRAAGQFTHKSEA